MRRAPAPISLAVLALALGCPAGGGDDDGVGPACEPASTGVAATWTITFVGFPEVSGNELESTGLDLEVDCTLDNASYADGELTLELACDHPMPSDPGGARVTITTAADGLPANLDMGETLTFDAYAAYFESIDGDHVREIWRALDLADAEHYRLSDDDGPVFVATVDSFGGSYGPIEVTSEYNCDGFDFCGAGTVEMDIRGYLHASSSDSEIDVQVGEVGVVEAGGLGWDLSLFQSWLDPDDCHQAEFGGYSLVRRPG